LAASQSVTGPSTPDPLPRREAERLGRPGERTLIAYDELMRLHVLPTLGDRPLSSLTRADVDAIVVAAPSAWRAHDAVKVLRMLLGRAVHADKIVRNPAEGIDLPKIDRVEPRTLTAEELERLADAVAERCRAPVLVGAFGFLRWSELIALRVDCLELPRNRVRVEERITEAGHLIVGEPKTARSRRLVTLPAFVTFELAEHLRRFPPGVSGLVFTAPKGGAIRRQTFYRRVWTPATITAGLDGFRVSWLRHTGTSLALEAGANPVLLAMRLGHTSSRMIDAHYTGRLDRADRELADALDARHGAARLRHAEGSGSGSDRRTSA
jgi:integrase